MKKNKGGYISSWGYVGYMILWSIPVFGWFIWFINCFSRKINKRNYARSIVCGFIFSMISSIVLSALIVLLAHFNVVPELTNALKELEGKI